MPVPAAVDRLTVDQARRIALAAQGFADRRPTGRIDVRHLRRAIDRVGVLQIDSVNVLVRSYELPLFSRLGAYPRTLLTDLVERRRELFEYWAHEASFAPVELHPLLRWRMEAAAGHAWGRMRRMQRDLPDYVAKVYAEVAERGPITAAGLVDAGEKSGPWWGWSKGKTALEWLFWAGDITSAGRGPNFERRYDLPERVLPPDVLDAPTPPIEEAHRQLLLRAARHHGIGTARDLADYFRIKVPAARPRLLELVEDGSLLPVQVDGWREIAYLHPDASRPRRVRARALLSPFDSLVWERSRAERLFGVKIRIELYTPAHKRVHGYYVLPFLLGEEVVARVDLKSDRKQSRLLVQSAWVDPAHASSVAPEAIAPELAEELRLLASWLGLDDITIVRKGDLAAALARAL
ncbi:MAG TPA: crosslink repair DNA glycosylase YcaQ family protein [Acidimicrobiales bacterium]|nr:crosslink repair DNA glycosylase YcaQ family protein [Acidimicrobiales bacterium]